MDGKIIQSPSIGSHEHLLLNKQHRHREHDDFDEVSLIPGSSGYPPARNAQNRSWSRRAEKKSGPSTSLAAACRCAVLLHSPLSRNPHNISSILCGSEHQIFLLIASTRCSVGPPYHCDSTAAMVAVLTYKYVPLSTANGRFERFFLKVCSCSWFFTSFWLPDLWPRVSQDVGGVIFTRENRGQNSLG